MMTDKEREQCIEYLSWLVCQAVRVAHALDSDEVTVAPRSEQVWRTGWGPRFGPLRVLH